jgi:hypothetical protein
MTASRVGGVKGFNATSESRIVRVIADEDEIDTGRGSLGTWVRYPDPRDLVENQWARLGSGHPWEPQALKAGSYRIIENRGQGCWIVEVIYYRNNITIGIPPTNEWLIRYRGATITEQALTELPPETVSAEATRSAITIKHQNLEARRATPAKAVSASESIAGVADLWTRPSRQVGSKAFKQVPAATSELRPTHRTQGVNDEGALIDIWLKEMPEELTEEPRGVIIEDPAWLVTFERTIPNFSSRQLPMSIAKYMKAVNGTTFRGAQPLHVKVLDITLDPIGAEVAGQVQGGVAYRVMVSFLWSYMPWGPYQIVNSWYDGDGHRATVLKIAPPGGVDAPDLSEFRNVRRENLNVLLTVLERGW